MIKIGLKAIKLVLEEEPLNNPKLQRQRLSECRECPSLNKSKMKCRECGCYVEIKAEMKYNYNPLQGMKIELTHCPLAKWPDSDRKIVNYYRKEYGKAPLKK